MTNEEILEKLKNYSTPELADGMGANYRVMDYEIKPRISTQKIVGRAVTVDVPAGVSGFVPTGIMAAGKGEILVVAGKGFVARAYWGDHRSACAQMQGIEGVIIDGSMRDIEGCREIGVQIFSKAIVPVSCKKEAEGVLNVPVECGGVTVNPGDYIVGDENGVIVIRPDEVEDVFPKADRKINAQAKTMAEMKRTGQAMPKIRYDL